MAEAVTARQTAQPQRADPQRSAARPARQGAMPARAGIDRLQRALGNRAMTRLLRSGAIQAKLTVGPTDDEYEREADRVADEVMRMPEPAAGLTAQRTMLRVQRVCPEYEEEVQRQADDLEVSPNRPIGTLLSGEAVVQRSPRGNAPAEPIDGTLERRVHALQGHGQPLPRSDRGFMESRFGYTFDAVRIHTGSRAGELASALNARAFTLGHNVVFAAGSTAPARRRAAACSPTSSHTSYSRRLPESTPSRGNRRPMRPRPSHGPKRIVCR